MASITLAFLRSHSDDILRAGLAFVFLWFGWSGVSNPGMWVAIVPSWTSVIATPEILVFLHGIFEIVFGLLLFAGIWTGPVAFILFLNLLHTITLLPWGPIMARDIAIASALLSLALAPRA